MGTRPASRRRQALLFARNFLKHPRMLGSVIPSSRFLIRELVAEIDWRRARVLVEYGPGVGNITAELLRRMPPDAVLFVFETNADFVGHLRRSLRDPRLHVVHGSAEEADAVLARHGRPRADYVVSGIPFSTIPPAARESILRRTRGLLHPDGKFLVYQFSGAVLPHLVRTFRHVRKDFEPLNILPARLFYCTP
ncbi:MAG TPA: rRNA adenine N-6-methyltransferase family protein [Longimicrobiaceae bacterium]|nr:rRNA adenine N-6-methyltransferase family protein [Longimicrobiaceae bacterium]